MCLNSLKKFNTLNLSIKSDSLFILDDFKYLKNFYLLHFKKKKPLVLIGEGSNILFLNNFYGTVLINRVKGRIIIDQNIDYWLLEINSGENWSDLVNFTLNNGIYGLENLSFIPGSVGSSVVNNIGAYGLELKNFLNYVKVFDILSGKEIFIKKKNCCLSYRESLFKNIFFNRFIILKVGLKIKKRWKPFLWYKDLINSFDYKDNSIKSEDIYLKVFFLRKKKLPDIRYLGNVGSFFKNPVIDYSIYLNLINLYPEIFDFLNIYFYKNFFFKKKISAAYLIDKCGLKYKHYGGARLFHKNPLIIVNSYNASYNDIYHFSFFIRKKVFLKFKILLNFEVQFIDSNKIDKLFLYLSNLNFFY